MTELRIAVDDGTGLSEKDMEAPRRFLDCLREAGMEVPNDIQEWTAYDDGNYRFTVIRTSLQDAMRLVENGRAQVAMGFEPSRRLENHVQLYGGSVSMYGPRHRRFKFWLVGVFHRLDPCDAKTEQEYEALEEFLYLLRLRRGAGSSGSMSDSERGGRH